MLDIKWIRENPDALDAALAKRNTGPEAERLIEFDEKRRANIAHVQDLQQRRNTASKQIGKAKASGDEAAAQAVIAEVAKLKTALQEGEETERALEAELRDALAIIPNVPAADVPVGPDEAANVELKQVGAKRSYSFTAKEHFDIGEPLGMDFESAAKLSGSRFVVLKGQMARLERALGQFMLDLHTTEHGFTEVQPPLLVRDDALFGTSQLPKFAEDLFSAVDLQRFSRALAGSPELWNAHRDLPERTGSEDAEATILGASDFTVRYDQKNWLIPTAEVPLTNLVRESITSEAELPLRYAALTPCFRSEAGAAGQDTRGMMRQHQFDKVELVSITTPEKSVEEHERMLASAEAVLQRLDLHYRVMTLSTGDMGFAAEKTWDIEVWLPGQARYREISSVSRCSDFQARRMDARYRNADGKTHLVHTLNGSGVAVGRALIAVLETYQNEDGSVTVPSALAPYMGGIATIGA